jgi:hypothetical protein
MSDEIAQQKPRKGRPPLEVDDKTRRQVRTLAGLGLSVADIGRVVEIAEGSVRNHYLDDLEIGRAQAKAKVAGSLFRMATNEDKPNVVAAIFWLKNRAGWKDVSDQTVSVVQGGIDAPPRCDTVEDAEAWLARRRRELAELTEQAKPKPPIVDAVAEEPSPPEPAPPAPQQSVTPIWTATQEQVWRRQEQRQEGVTMDVLWRDRGMRRW